MIDSTRTQLREKRDRLQSQWSLFLAVGNGGFLTAIGSKVLDGLYGKDKLPDIHPILDFAFPLIVIFSFGVVFSALIPLFELVATHRLLRQTSDLEKAVDRHWDNPLNWVPEFLAAGCFVGGVACGAYRLLHM